MPRSKEPIRSVRTGVVPAVANLAAATLVSGDAVMGAFETAFTVVKAALRGRFDPDVAESSCEVGICVDELTDAEVEAYLELDGPTEPGQVDQGEVITRGRFIKSFGMLGIDGRSVDNAVQVVDKEDSAVLHIREGQTFRVWIYNHGSAALGGAAACAITAHLLGRWAKSS